MFTDATFYLDLEKPVKTITDLEVALEDLSSYNRSLQVEIGHNQIALEMINFNDAMKYLRTLTAKVGLVHKLTREKTEFAPTIEVYTAKQLAAQKTFLDVNFADVRKVQIYKPVGLSVTFLELIGWLKDYQELFAKLPETAMVPFIRYLRTTIEDPTELRGLPKEMVKLDDPDAISKELGKMFRAPEGVDVGEMGQLLRRMRDIPEVHKGVEELTTRFNAVGRDDILNSIDVVLKTLDEMALMFKNEGITPSKAFVSAVADHTTKLAKLAAGYSLYTGKLLALSEAMSDNVSRFKEIESKL